MKPITRQEVFLANAAGESTQELKPITRLEHFLKNVADHVKSIGNGGGGTGGGASIDVTAQEGQTIVVKEVDANGKPTAWEGADYQPRTHWSEVVTILPETTVEIDPEAGAGIIPYDFTVEGGKKYNVMYNGVEYADCECIYDEGVHALGNAGAITEGLPVTNHPFFLAHTPDGGMDENGNPIFIWVVVPLDGSTSVTMSIIENVNHTIPDKYIPENYYEITVNAEYVNKGVDYLAYDTTELVNALLLGKQIFVNTISYQNGAPFRMQALILSVNGPGNNFKEAINNCLVSGVDVSNIPLIIVALKPMPNVCQPFTLYINMGAD